MVTRKQKANHDVGKGGAGARPEFRPRAVLKLHDWVEVPYEDGVQKVLAERYGVKRLLAWEIVEGARPDAPAVDPVVDATDDPRSPNQGYLNPAPEGIDVEFAWTVAGGAGAGQRVVDLEGGWTLDHEDLAAHGATLLFGTLVNASRPHGTSVLGAESSPCSAVTRRVWRVAGVLGSCQTDMS